MRTYLLTSENEKQIREITTTFSYRTGECAFYSNGTYWYVVKRIR